MADNFDVTRKEPNVLPSRFPNVLVNGSMGIAVGMATNIPPHNLGEVIDGCVAYIDNPDIDTLGLMEYIKHFSCDAPSEILTKFGGTEDGRVVFVMIVDLNTIPDA